MFELLAPGFRMDRESEIKVLRTEGSPAREICVRFPAYDQLLTGELV